MTWTKLAVSFLTLFALLIIWMTLEIWAAAFLGVLFALSINGPAAWMRQHVRMPPWFASLLVMLAVLVLFIGLGLLIGPSLSDQFEDMSTRLPKAVESALHWLDDRPGGRRIVESFADWSGVPKMQLLGKEGGSNDSGNDMSDSAMPPGVLQLGDESTSQSDESDDATSEEQEDETTDESPVKSDLPGLGEILGPLAGAIVLTVKTVSLLGVSFVMMLFVAFDPHVYQRGMMWLVPREHENAARETMDWLSVAMRWWMVGRLASMIAVGTFTSIGMWMIGMPDPMALGAISAILTFVPTIGPILAAIPGLLLSVGQGPWMMFAVLCVYVVAELLESHAITPLVEQYTVSVPPGVLIVTQFAFAALGGVWAMIVATPLLVLAMVLVQQLYVRHGLQKSIEVTGS